MLCGCREKRKGVMRLGLWDLVRISGRCCGFPDSDALLDNGVVVSRRRVVCSLTLYECSR